MKMIDIAEFRERVKNGKQKPQTAVRLVGPMADPVAATDARTVTFVFSDNSVDRYGDTIDARGWVLDNYNANPIALFGHDANTVENVIGRARNVRVEGQKLIGDIEFMPAETNPTAEAVYQMVKGGFLKTVSVGFQPIEWNLTKDKGRPGGVDFKKQELLEISIVAIPANPNALQQAKAAGIDIDRLNLIERDGAPVVSKKGMYAVGALARLLAELGWIEDDAQWEAEYEGDGSEVPQMLADAMKQLGAALIAMTIEEVAELLATNDGADDALIIVGDPMEMNAGQRALQRLAQIARDGAALAPRKQVVNIEIELSAEAKEILGQMERAGKVLSAANETALRNACDHMTKAMDHVTGVIGAAEPVADETEEKSAEEAEQERHAKARKRKLALVPAVA